MKAFDLAGQTKFPRGPHAARGLRVGKPWLTSTFFWYRGHWTFRGLSYFVNSEWIKKDMVLCVGLFGDTSLKYLCTVIKGNNLC